jgi:type II secretory pathway pseudopilin PulG
MDEISPDRALLLVIGLAFTLGAVMVIAIVALVVAILAVMNVRKNATAVQQATALAQQSMAEVQRLSAAMHRQPPHQPATPTQRSGAEHEPPPAG